MRYIGLSEKKGGKGKIESLASKIGKIFMSKLEEIMPAEELIFEPTPAFGKYKEFLKHAVAHPAKMNTNLLEFLIKNSQKMHT